MNRTETHHNKEKRGLSGLIAAAGDFFANLLQPRTATSAVAPPAGGLSSERGTSLMDFLEQSLCSEEDREKLRAAYARGDVAKRRMLKEDGGTIGPSEVAELLGVDVREVDSLRCDGKLLGVVDVDDDIESGYIYPVWQFQGKGTVPGFAEVMQILEDNDPWTKMIFFLNQDSSINYNRPIDMLREGEIDEALRAASVHGDQGTV